MKIVFNIKIKRMAFRNRRELKKIDNRIKAIKKAAQELKELSGGIQAIDRNAEGCSVKDQS